MMNEQIIGVLHIPKTGGRSLRCRLHQPETTHHIDWRTSNLRRPGLKWVSMLRDPLDRAVSLFRYFQQFQGASNKPERLLHSMIRFANNASDFWERVDVDLIKSCVIHFHSQSKFMRGATLGDNLFLYDFSKFEDEVLRIEEEHSVSVSREKIHYHKTERSSVDEELSLKARRKIRDHYKEDVLLYESLFSES